jgi:two-component system response regulator GlrR
VRSSHAHRDLYYRLQMVPIFVRPLRDRPEDIPVLARHFIRQLTQEGEPPMVDPGGPGRAARPLLARQGVRLRNVIERALAFSPAPDVLQARHLCFGA